MRKRVPDHQYGKSEIDSMGALLVDVRCCTSSLIVPSMAPMMVMIVGIPDFSLVLNPFGGIQVIPGCGQVSLERGLEVPTGRTEDTMRECPRRETTIGKARANVPIPPDIASIADIWRVCTSTAVLALFGR